MRPGWYSVIAAGAAGVAGTLAYLEDRTDTLIGAVASVALLPASAAAGIALVAGDPVRAAGGAALLLMNTGFIIAMGLVVIAILRPASTPSDPQDAAS